MLLGLFTNQARRAELHPDDNHSSTGKCPSLSLKVVDSLTYPHNSWVSRLIQHDESTNSWKAKTTDYIDLQLPVGCSWLASSGRAPNPGKMIFSSFLLFLFLPPPQSYYFLLHVVIAFSMLPCLVLLPLLPHPKPFSSPIPSISCCPSPVLLLFPSQYYITPHSPQVILIPPPWSTSSPLPSLPHLLGNSC